MTVYNSLRDGLTPLTIVNGGLCTVLDNLLVTLNSWTILFSSTNARIYQPPAGIGNRLYVNHDSAVSGTVGAATVRGCEGAASIASLTDPFPTVAQCPNNRSTWVLRKVSTAYRTTYHYHAIVTDRFLLFSTFCAEFGGNTTEGPSACGMFGDVPSGIYGTDPYGCVMVISNTTSTNGTSEEGMWNGSWGSRENLTSAFTTTATNWNVFWMRDISGATKSVAGGFAIRGSKLGGMSEANGGAEFGNNNTNNVTARSTFGNRLYREELMLNCSGSASTNSFGTNSLYFRGRVPNCWNPIGDSGNGPWHQLQEGGHPPLVDSRYPGDPEFMIVQPNPILPCSISTNAQPSAGILVDNL